VNDLALAFAPSRELLLETSQQGRSFLDAVLVAWNTPALQRVAAALPGPVAYPVAVGLAAAAHDIPLLPTLQGYLLAFVQNLVSAAIRLAPIGQTAGTQIIATLLPCVTRVAQAAETTDLDGLGSTTFRADLGSFKHETQYTRLFRS
jgi:urease accessory protein